MSTTLAEPAADASGALDEAELEYRSVHTMAVLGLLLGLCAAVTLFTSDSIEYTLAISPIPLLGLVVSIASLRAIAAAPELYTGKPLAQTGALLSAFFLVTGLGYASYVYATEVPDGYARLSFVDMKPTESDLVDRKPIPDDVQEVLKSGEKIFIKGYIRPDSVKFKQNINRFLLVRDSNECCFGDASKVKYFDQVQVKLDTGLTTDFSRGVFRLGGVLKVGPGNPQLGTVLTYTLDADYVNP